MASNRLKRVLSHATDRQIEEMLKHAKTPRQHHEITVVAAELKKEREQDSQQSNSEQ